MKPKVVGFVVRLQGVALVNRLPVYVRSLYLKTLDIIGNCQRLVF